MRAVTPPSYRQVLVPKSLIQIHRLPLYLLILDFLFWKRGVITCLAGFF